MRLLHQFSILIFLYVSGMFFTPVAATSSRFSCVLNTDTRETDPCNEPAPTNFHITDVTTTTISVEWDTPGSPPFQYNIKAIEVVSGITVYNQNIGGNLTNWTVPNLQPGVQYEIKNTPICPDGQVSQYFVSDLGSTLIIDLLVSSFSPSSAPESCGMQLGGQFCYADPTGGDLVTFRVETKVDGQLEYRYFGVYKANDECVITTLMLRPEESGSIFQFYCEDGSGPSCNGSKILVKYGYGSNPQTIAMLTLGHLSQDLQRLVCQIIEPDFSIMRLGDQYGDYYKEDRCPDLSDGGRPVSTTQPSRQAPTSISTTPNPFTDQIDLTIPFAHPNEATEISLYNLQGRRVLLTRVPGNQPNVRISTENLSPGMYFLRAESGGIYQTAKVVKTH